MLDLTLEALLSYLQEKGRDTKLQKETHQIYEVLSIDDKEFPLFIKINPDSDILQFITFLPLQFESDAIPDIARLILFINKEMDLPGFGMDESSKMVFYRCVLPSLDKKVSEETLQVYLQTIELVCKTFSPALLAVMQGKMTFEDVLKKVVKS